MFIEKRAGKYGPKLQRSAMLLAYEPELVAYILLLQSWEVFL
jgi:hypothetical protein